MGSPFLPYPGLSHSAGRRAQAGIQGVRRHQPEYGSYPHSCRHPGDPNSAVRCHPDRSPPAVSHRILIVDDEAGIRQALKQVLEYEDLMVRVAASGGEAITMYPEYRPHL